MNNKLLSQIAPSKFHGELFQYIISTKNWTLIRFICKIIRKINHKSFYPSFLVAIPQLGSILKSSPLSSYILDLLT
jgi:hypothetical protein